MDPIKLFINKYSYKFKKGYPDVNSKEDMLLLEDLLNEKFGINLNEEQLKLEFPEKSKKEEDLEKIIKIVNKEHSDKITKTQLFDLLANYTYEYYQENLGDIKEVFPSPISKIENWKDYVDKKESNIGKEVEQAFVKYSEENGVDASSIRGKGTDVNIGGKLIEIKSREGNNINTQLQTSFYKNDPNKFYAFVTNTSLSDINVRIVSSQLLYKLSLGDDVADEINVKGTSEKLKEQIKKGLESLDFPHFIETSIVTGESANMGKSFKIGNNVRVRFVIYIEPQ